jgi:DNA-binding transcriptional LysR family regulator
MIGFSITEKSVDHREELEVLVETARAGNMRRAAERLGLPQSTLSEVISRLETSYGAPLFLRDRRGTRPTAYGEVVTEAAERALRVLVAARREVGLIKGAECGRLAIGGEPALIGAYLATAIARGLNRFPKLRFRLHPADASGAIRELRERQVDLVFGLPPDGATEGLSVREVGDAHVIPFCRPDHPLAGAGSTELGEVLSFPIAQGAAPRWYLNRMVETLRQSAGRGTLRNAAVIVGDYWAVRTIVRDSDAVGFFPLATLEEDLARGTLSRIELQPQQQELLRVPLIIATLEDRALPPSATTLIGELEQVIRELS